MQILDIVQDFGIVVISRYGSNPEKFVYESDILNRLKVSNGLGTPLGNFKGCRSEVNFYVLNHNSRCNER